MGTIRPVVFRVTQPEPVVIQPDIVPNESQFQYYSKFNGPLNQGILDLNTTYQINYPNGTNWVYIDIDNHSVYEGKASNLQSFSLNQWVTQFGWRSTSYVNIKVDDRNGNYIYEPTTLTPIS